MIPVGVVAGSIASAVVPSAPTSFSASPTGNSVALSWSPPTQTGGAAFLTYTVKRGATTIYVGVNTSFNDTGLTNATSYSYTVFASNNAGDGPTASVSTTTLAPPSAPTSFSATAASSSSINLSWAAPSSNGGAALANYILRRSGTVIYNGTGTSFTDTGLSPATAYSYTVVAQNFVGFSSSASASATTSAGVPSAITVYTNTQTANQSGNWSWTAPANNGSPILYYALSGYIGTTTPSTSYSTNTGAYGEFSLTVAAVNAIGTGPSTTWSLFIENLGQGYWD
jgi:hypothetical protein